jgi:hypothetical protein
MNAVFFSIFVSHFDLIITGGQTKSTEISISLKKDFDCALQHLRNVFERMREYNQN